MKFHETLPEVMFFSPYSGIWPHSLSEYQIALNIDKRKFTISLVNCGGVLDLHCAVKESRRLYESASKKTAAKACTECIKCANEIGTSVFDAQVFLSDRISKTELDEIANFVEKVRAEDFPNLLFEGLEIGRLTSYETLIKYKKTSTELNEVELNHWKTSLYQGLVTFKAGQRLLDERKPTRILIYSPQYASGSVFAECGRLKGIQTYFVEGSSNISERYSAVRIWDWEIHGLVNPALGRNKSIPQASDEEIARVDAHINEINRAKSFSVYSPKSSKPVDIRTHFKIAKEKKLLIAALSSYDEAFSAYILERFPKSKYQGIVYTDQFEWITDLMNWIQEKPQYHLVIRLHPRDLSTRRENIVSEQSKLWRKLLGHPPKNVSIDYPEDELSIFDYYKQVDAFTTGWSSTALEALINGIPVVTYDSGMPSYPNSIHFTGSTRQQYFENLDQALEAGRDELNRRNGINWWAYIFTKGTVRIPGRLQDRSYVSRSNLLTQLVKVAEYFIPRVTHKIEQRVSKKYGLSPEFEKLNTLLSEGKKDLFYD